MKTLYVLITESAASPMSSEEFHRRYHGTAATVDDTTRIAPEVPTVTILEGEQQRGHYWESKYERLRGKHR